MLIVNRAHGAPRDVRSHHRRCERVLRIVRGRLDPPRKRGLRRGIAAWYTGKSFNVIGATSDHSTTSLKLTGSAAPHSFASRARISTPDQPLRQLHFQRPTPFSTDGAAATDPRCDPFVTYRGHAVTMESLNIATLSYDERSLPLFDGFATNAASPTSAGRRGLAQHNLPRAHPSLS